MVAYRLLVIEDNAVGDASVRAALGHDAEFNCQQVAWEASAPERLRRADVHGIVAVAVPDGSRAIDLFESLRTNPIATPTLAVLPHDATQALAGTVSRTADDFLYAPVRPDELRHRLIRLLGAPRRDIDAVRERLIQEMGLMQLVGREPAFVSALEQVPRFARSEMPVLITGETGTGKELFARAIHHLSRRRASPFIAVDCGTIPDHLFENELFGHARGAYTDANGDQRGLIALADGGTLFLDEIDALSLPTQGKLLRFLQERTFRPLGAERFHHADVNVLAATNRDLELLVGKKQFRADLFYRLNVLRLHLPPLRKRRGDTALLVQYFLKEIRASTQLSVRSFSAAALRMLALHDWPGNVRELANVVQRACVACDDSHILPCHVLLGSPTVDNEEAPARFRTARAAAIATFEHRYVQDLLRKHGGNVTQAAREAHKDRRAFGRLIKKYRIDRNAG